MSSYKWKENIQHINNVIFRKAVTKLFTFLKKSLPHNLPKEKFHKMEVQSIVFCQ